MQLSRPLAAVVSLVASLCAASSVAVWAPASATARAYRPPPGHVFAGLTGGTSIGAYQRMVGKHPAVFEVFMTWNTATAWLAAPDRSFRARLGVAVSTAAGYKKSGVISPKAIALGGSDRFLVSMNRNLARSGRIVYVRLMGEMNGYWNAYAAFNADGSSRGEQNSPHFYIEAWRRSVLILRGGRISAINRRLRGLGLPPLKAGLRARARLPSPRVAFLWVPQDAGSPDTSANAPAAFWPGGAYVDWVGTDFYASYANFGLLNQFYAEFAGKPFVLSEWALYGADEPGFVRALFAWVRTHPRVRMLNYYQGFTASSPASLRRYPASRAALRRELKSRRYLAYPPEYAHPKRHRKPARPPLPPAPAAPPGPAPSPPPGPSPVPPPGTPPVCVKPLSVCLPGL